MNDLPEADAPGEIQILPPSGDGWCDPVTGVCQIDPVPRLDHDVDAEMTLASAEDNGADTSSAPER